MIMIVNKGISLYIVIIVFLGKRAIMKIIYIKIALLATIGVAHSASLCMLQSAKTRFDKKTTKKAAEVVRAINAQTIEAPLALPKQRSAMEGNFFTELPREVRGDCVPSYKPNRDMPF